MRICTFMFLFCVAPLMGVCQQNKSNQFNDKKSFCLDSMSVFLIGMASNEKDTVIKYSKLMESKSLGIAFRHCTNRPSAIILSFELIINKKRKQSVEGNQFDFNTLKELAGGGTVTITNCLVQYSDDMTLSKRVILPEKRLTVIQ